MYISWMNEIKLISKTIREKTHVCIGYMRNDFWVIKKSYTTQSIYETNIKIYRKEQLKKCESNSYIEREV